jgi:glycosyltransferase involved in cell wall biosynthesis
MRVLAHFRTHILDSRGTPLRSRNLVSWLGRRDGVELSLLSQDPSPEVRRLLGLEHHRIPSTDRAPETLVKEVERIRPDLVYGFTHKAAPDLARLAGTGRPRLVVDLHGDLAWEKLEDRHRPLSGRLRGFLSSRLDELRTLRRLDGFTVVSEALRKRVASSRRPALLLLGGVDPDLFSAPPAAPRPTITVGYAGSFRSYHGIDDLVSSGARLVASGEPFRFLLIGDLGQAPQLGRRIERELGDSATVLTAVGQDKIPGLLARCDVLIVPRRRGRAAELNYPSKLSEYLAMNRPVIVTDVGQAGRLADTEGIAVKVPANDPAALTEALLALRDPGLRSQLAVAGRAYAVEHLAWDKIAATLEAFLRRIASAAHS